jgi:hypothetical protein
MEMCFVTHHYRVVSIFSKNGEHFLTKISALCKIRFGQLLDEIVTLRAGCDVANDVTNPNLMPDS